MLMALVRDLIRIPGAEVDVLADPDITEFHRFRDGLPPSCSILETDTLRLISRLRSIASYYDAVIPIAPESSGLLVTVANAIRSAGGSALLPSEECIRLTGNKWRTFLKCEQTGIPTVPTEFLAEFDVHRWSSFSSPAGCIVKPTDGAGSEGIWRVTDAGMLARLQSDLHDTGLRRWLIQPLLDGTHLSVGVLCIPSPATQHSGNGDASTQYQVLPVAEQIFEPESAFAYKGGRIPARISEEIADEVRALAVRVCECFESHSGYVGLDLLITDDAMHPIRIVDINPRLTTSFVGYQRLCEDNLTARLLGCDEQAGPLRWRTDALSFWSDGTVDSRVERV